MWQKDTWQREDYMALQAYLWTLVDEKYKSFHLKLTPGLSEESLLGVRLPLLRSIAKEIHQGNSEAFLANPRHDYYEEIMIHGFVLGKQRGELASIMAEIRRFIPYITNWAICDSFVSSLHIVRNHQEEFYSFFYEYLHKQDAFTVRFAIVAFMDYYTDSTYIHDILTIYDQVRHEDYYVKMAVAWGISVAYIKEETTTMKFLQQNHLDDFTYNKALQKIIESNRVTTEQKEMMRKMKRK